MTIFPGALGLNGLSAPAKNAASTSAKKGAASGWTVGWKPARVANGSPILFQVTPPSKLDSLSATWFGHSVSFFADARKKTWYGIGGVSLETAPGKYTLNIRGQAADGQEVTFTQQLPVARAKYRRIEVTVAKQFTEPSAEQMREISADKTIKERVFAKVDPIRHWKGTFVAPVEASISDRFGTTRTFNGHVRSFHQGLDYAVREGTVVRAVNGGTVLLAKPLYFEGGCVILDHGQGLLTIYMHLSKIEVKEGEQVSTGQKIALSGGTGRATGPHLHVAVRWQGIYLDPLTLLKLKLPT